MSDSLRRGQQEDREWMSRRTRELIAREVVFWAPRHPCWLRTLSRILVSPKTSLRVVCNSLTVSETNMQCSSNVKFLVNMIFSKHWYVTKKVNTSQEGPLSVQALTSHNVLHLVHSLYQRIRRIATEKLDQALLTTRIKTRAWIQRSSKSQMMLI